jgi:hypothetical protein
MAHDESLEVTDCDLLLQEIEAQYPPEKRSLTGYSLTRYAHLPLPLPERRPRIRKGLRLIFHRPECPRLTRKNRCTCDMDGCGVKILGKTRQWGK